MRKRVAVGANDPATASSSGSEAAEEDLFAAEQRLGGDQPAAEPAWSDDEEGHPGSVSGSEDSQQESDESEAIGSEADTDAGSEASSELEGSAPDDDELDTAIVDYAAATGEHADQAERDSLAAVPDGEPEGTLRVDEGSDSSEDERPPRNTVGEVPLQWYNGEEHIGYDRDAKKLIKRTRKDKLETLLAQTDTKQGLRTIYDEYNDEEIVLSKDELRMIQRIRQGQFPDVEVNPYEPEMNWFTDDTEIMPLSAAPEPKRRFIPSKWEEKK